MRFESKAVTPETLAAEVQPLADAGWRLVTMSQTVVDENTLALYYHFDKELEMTHLRMEVDKNKPIPSISGSYFCAVLIENETQDQFGVRFEGLPLDYQGGFYLEGEVTHAPYFTMTTAIKNKADKPSGGAAAEEAEA